MATLAYTAIRPDGKIVTGRGEAASEEALGNQLARERLELVEVKEVGRPNRMKNLRRTTGKEKAPRRDVADFFFQMGTLLKAGVPILQALELVADGMRPGNLQTVVRNLAVQIQGGTNLQEAMAQFPGVFPDVVICLIRVADKTGTLPQVCEELRAYLNWLDKMAGEIKQATTYPIVLLVTVAIFIVGMFTFVVPSFAKVLKDMKIPLPALTRFVLGASDFFVGNIIPIVCTILLILVLAHEVPRRFPAVAVWMDGMKLRIPIFGPLNLMICISRFGQNLATMYRSGMLILESLALSRDLIGNRKLAAALGRVHDGVASGRKIAETMKETDVFPPLVLQMVQTGENTGQLAESLQNVTDYYNDVIPRAIKRVFGILQPLITFMLIGIVAVVALSIILPLTEMMKVPK
ncbi:MAG: type II secretion system F family protein [Proteobacteria bacterium]|nr:type II secretion system F family protein [Pseudomonadota bacterium]NBS50098.1 type II secretion system F family protein [Verrucomicrobiota bacterium]NBS79233.1 type II secretion system F family protein [bacterium]